MTTLSQVAAAKADRSLGKGLTFVMAMAAGVAVANIYYNQPMLGLMERDLAFFAKLEPCRDVLSLRARRSVRPPGRISLQRKHPRPVNELGS